MNILPLKAAARATRRAGLTLIELVVVLTILVALGSLLVPVIGNALTRSHVATCASNIPEIAKTITGTLATNGTLGDDWSTGVFDAGVATNGGSPVNAIVGLEAAGGTVTLAAAALTPEESAAMAELGITRVFNHGDPATVGEYDVTFNTGYVEAFLGTGPGGTATPTPVITLTDAQATNIFLSPPVNPTAPAAVTDPPLVKYIWLGIDKENDLVGTAFPEAPVHFGDTEGAFPNQVYSRFGAIFRITDPFGADNASADFVMVSYNLEGGDGFETADNHIAIHWDEVQGSGL